MLGGQGGKSFEIWEVLFRDMGGAVWGVGVQYKHFEIWEVLFRDMRDAVSIYERCCFEIWEVLFRDMGGADYSQRQYSCPAPYCIAFFDLYFRH